MINLNDNRFKSKWISEEDLSFLISDYDIYKKYIGESFSINKAISSPFREDSNPSFSIFRSHKTGKLLFKDFGTGETGGAVRFVQLLFNVPFKDAIDIIMGDFNLSDKKYDYKIKIKNSDKKRAKEFHKDISIKSRNWNSIDKKYWYNKYQINKSILELYNIKPVEYIFLNNHIFKADRHSYAYIEYKDNEKRYKIYQPYSNTMKWINNYIEGTLSGFNQLPENGDLLFIASSMKDGLVLKTLGYDFIAPQTEKYIFKKHIIDQLKNRFKKIITLYDNDNTGIESAHKMKELYDVDYIIPDEFFKDISDYMEYNKKEKTKKFIENDIQKFIH